MNLLKLLVATASITAALLLAGCDDCGPFTNYELRATARMLDAVNAPENPNETSVISSSVSYDEFIVDLEMSATSRKSNILSNISFSFISNAHACSPPSAPYEIPLTQLEITSDSDFNEAYPAGANLAELFYVEYFFSRYTTDANNYFMFTISDLIARGVNEPERLQLRLLEAPNLSSRHTLVIKVNEESHTLDKVVFE